MDPSDLKPGDTVISLGALTITTTIIAGGINTAIILWQFNQTWWLSVAGFLAVVLIWIVARLTGLLMFFERDAYVIVVKPGESALPGTLTTAIIGSAVALIIFGFAFAYVLGGPQLLMASWSWVTFASIIIGVIWGTLSASV